MPNKYSYPLRSPFRPLAIAVATAGFALSSASYAQDAPLRGTAALLEEVTVTARKREELAQDVPTMITAFNSEQIEALKVRDLNDLTIGIPNVMLEDNGTFRGTASFAIRGIGITSSIPSIDPTVGTFVNGVYLAVNQGIIFDMFDVDTIEVLRGPQGTLFGRNVTGGAVLINTKVPGDQLEASVRTAVETGDIGGNNTYVMGAVGGPLTDTLGGRLVLYYNNDDGQLENKFNGDDVLGIEQKMARGTLLWRPGDNTDLTLRYEYQDTNGDGPAAQSHTNGFGVPGTPVNFNRDDFDLSIDEKGFQDTDVDFVTAQLDQGVSFGDGTVTAIFGYRDYQSESLSDIDAQPVWMFHAPVWLDAEQTSFELRYNGIFAEKMNVTTGLYYLGSDVTYNERRELLGVATGNVAPALRQNGGGEHNTDAYTAFAQVDYDLTDRWTLTAGINYSSEDKDVKIASLGANVSRYPNLDNCNIVKGPKCDFDFIDDESWDNWAPKLGATFHIDDDSNIYGHWTRGYRSGGYNLRNTVVGEEPGPFDEEEVNSYELGYKSTHDWGRLNAATFYTTIDDQQREVNLPSATAGVAQLIKNTADTNIYGGEIDATISLTENLLLLGSAGYTHAEYDTVRFDLNGDGVVDGKDEGLDIPRAPEWTYSIGLSHDLDLGDWGVMTSRINYAYRDDFAYTDNNL
ncbi:MAG: TonB-dependent receptor, partial [Gammaproteobacteria bacterium]|nr:TonB-dependent receptor [Gammaproteobacteria bacterium]